MSEYNKLQTCIIEKNIPEDSQKFSQITMLAWFPNTPYLSKNGSQLIEQLIIFPFQEM